MQLLGLGLALIAIGAVVVLGMRITERLAQRV